MHICNHIKTLILYDYIYFLCSMYYLKIREVENHCFRLWGTKCHASLFSSLDGTRKDNRDTNCSCQLSFNSSVYLSALNRPCHLLSDLQVRFHYKGVLKVQRLAWTYAGKASWESQKENSTQVYGRIPGLEEATNHHAASLQVVLGSMVKFPASRLSTWAQENTWLLWQRTWPAAQPYQVT